MRIGFLGGSFDPPHVGHLLVAGDAYEALDLDTLLFIPAAEQPLKAGRAGARPDQRLAMVELLVAGDPRFAVDSIEIDRGGLSYMVETLAALAERYADAERFLLVGADVPRTFQAWREPERIVRLATVVVLQREAAAAALSGLLASARVLPSRRIDVSSTEVRARVQAGRSIHGFVPDAVAAYIEAERLYRERIA